ncbi:MAG: DNA repair protein RecO [Bacteriovoracaceae bacterium]|nr:DNA repair protein RecO [Bacteriovoracaceae bacterium]
MQTKIEGIVLQKSFYRDRDVIAKILLRSGKLLSVLFYGGRGGGKSQKSSIIELGFLLSVELKATTKVTELYSAREWALKWDYKQIRDNHEAFYLMCLFLEVIQSLGVQEDMKNVEETEHEGIFNVLSNAIFYLEKSVEAKNLNSPGQLLFFLTKLLNKVGVLPDLDHCTHCGSDLADKRIHLESNQGGFSCCLSQEQIEFSSDMDAQGIRHFMIRALRVPYAEIGKFELSHYDWSKILLRYLSFQFHFELNKFKSTQMLF